MELIYDIGIIVSVSSATTANTAWKSRSSINKNNSMSQRYLLHVEWEVIGKY